MNSRGIRWLIAAAIAWAAPTLVLAQQSEARTDGEGEIRADGPATMEGEATVDGEATMEGEATSDGAATVEGEVRVEAPAADRSFVDTRRAEPSTTDSYPEPSGTMDAGEMDGAQVSLIEQAGVGSTIAYARQGVVELGGTFGFNWAQHLVEFNVSPFVGVFVFDNLQLSGIFDIRYTRTEDGPVSTDSTSFTMLAEPSYHGSVDPRLFLFAGLGIGAAYNGLDLGFAIAPRVGVNILIGRSGILTPSFNVLFNTSGVGQNGSSTVVESSLSMGLNVGYSVMW
ncbi:MAG: hypothetical protein J0L92_19640 [Deltaproteobacteria bacterium]|nr:hypothetical protein [Deltaproteobacteria bacterium]